MARITPLPIDPHLPAVLDALGTAAAAVLVAEPGAGKTTRVPPAIVRSGMLAKDASKVLVLQPRRIAARASAARIADEQQWSLGREVGYHVRFDRRFTPQTPLRIITEGILTRLLLDDPLLDGVGCVILDEFHERSLHADLAIALLSEVRRSRPDLKVLVMSATLDAEPVAAFFGGCPILRVPGRLFPVHITHVPADARPMPDRVAESVRSAVDASDGDILAFLPGVWEIQRTHSALAGMNLGDGVRVLPLHGSLPAEQQDAAIRPASGGERKVILSTNIAETSLTIDGVTTVIDSGLVRVSAYDVQRGVDRLELRAISRASADQRSGRAGRTAAGRCIRLWTQKQHHELQPFDVPEIRRVDMASTVLTLHAWGLTDPRSFGWYDPPAESSLIAAERLLFAIGALTSPAGGRLTRLGTRMSMIPVHPRLARLLIDADAAGNPELGADIAAVLSERDFLRIDRSSRFADRTPESVGESDVAVRLIRLNEARRDRFRPSLRDRGIDPEAARQVDRLAGELLRTIGSRRQTQRQSGTPSSDRPSRESTLARREHLSPADPSSRPPPPLCGSTARPTYNSGSPPATSPDDLAGRLVLAAYPDRLCRRRESDPAAATMVGGSGVRLMPESVVRRHSLFVAVDPRADDRNRRAESAVSIASGVEPHWLGELFPQSVTRSTVASYDPSADRVTGSIVTRYHDLVLTQEPGASVAPEAAAELLRERLQTATAAMQDDAVQNLVHRIALLGRMLGEDSAFANPADLLATAIDDACAGSRSVADVRRKLPEAIESQLQWNDRQTLGREAPETIQVPTGNRIRLAYPSQDASGPVRSPTLSVRLQELFGLAEIPRIAAGRVAVTLELLGPNYRPVQITSDLASFWQNTYPQVRKDLRARYPKHSWPDDPLTAPPQAKGGRRR